MPPTSPKSYRVGFGPRAVNRIFVWLAKTGRGPQTLHILTTLGRRTGELRTVPVHVVQYEGSRWIVAIYGSQSWVRNALATPAVTLRRGSKVEHVVLEQAGSDTAEPVIAHYADQIPHVQPYLVEEGGNIDYARLARSHTVFEVVPDQPGPGSNNAS